MHPLKPWPLYLLLLLFQTCHRRNVSTQKKGKMAQAIIIWCVYVTWFSNATITSILLFIPGHLLRTSPLELLLVH